MHLCMDHAPDSKLGSLIAVIGLFTPEQRMFEVILGFLPCQEFIESLICSSKETELSMIVRNRFQWSFFYVYIPRKPVNPSPVLTHQLYI